ncbi:MAG TPA: hypothetical protein VKY19_10745 [Ktedonosporobacter sp.]|jgi:uncharacterized protein involved in response to NO|nr:hypothetical protein [Ktedonosporobacter sp.]
MGITTRSTGATANGVVRQEPFSRVAPLLKSALLFGAGGGFVLATVLTLTRAFSLPAGSWWTPLVQAHGHLQLFGWAGLFVLGVALHFLPRLRGASLALPGLLPWLLGALVSGLLLRACSQPLLAITGAEIWRILLVISGVLECVALVGAVALLAMTALHGPSLANRQAFQQILPFIVMAFGSLGLASVINLVNVIQAASSGSVPPANDDLNVTLGLLGFLVPMALAMSARSLPMYSGLEAFPQKLMWPLAITYCLGLMLLCAGTMMSAPWSGIITGGGMIGMGAVVILFVGIFLRLMRSRGRLPRKVTELAPAPQAVANSYRAKVTKERKDYGPFVLLVASAYLWAVLGGTLLVVDGVMQLMGAGPILALDAIRHSFAIGFIALLICGVAPRMISGFSGGNIMSPKLVRATLWLGNSAALLRVGSLLVAPLLALFQGTGYTIVAVTFGLSGPIGLALAICLAVNLWPALGHSSRT